MSFFLRQLLGIIAATHHWITWRRPMQIELVKLTNLTEDDRAEIRARRLRNRAVQMEREREALAGIVVEATKSHPRTNLTVAPASQFTCEPSDLSLVGLLRLAFRQMRAKVKGNTRN